MGPRDKRAGQAEHPGQPRTAPPSGLYPWPLTHGPAPFVPSPSMPYIMVPQVPPQPMLELTQCAIVFGMAEGNALEQHLQIALDLHLGQWPLGMAQHLSQI